METPKNISRGPRGPCRVCRTRWRPPKTSPGDPEVLVGSVGQNGDPQKHLQGTRGPCGVCRTRWRPPKTSPGDPEATTGTPKTPRGDIGGVLFGDTEATLGTPLDLWGTRGGSQGSPWGHQGPSKPPSGTPRPPSGTLKTPSGTPRPPWDSLGTSRAPRDPKIPQDPQTPFRDPPEPSQSGPVQPSASPPGFSITVGHPSMDQYEPVQCPGWDLLDQHCLGLHQYRPVYTSMELEGARGPTGSPMCALGQTSMNQYEPVQHPGWDLLDLRCLGLHQYTTSMDQYNQYSSQTGSSSPAWPCILWTSMDQYEPV
ncbi:mucin-2-like [Myiozetetes cayanensis]|uniref:mucin-2-like n=1 Tax=Myiozetetes cayanensis TaxID=478635 RepID=UPI00215F085B|nr:mucin-2-like [Myiozetetes cayanensis]